MDSIVNKKYQSPIVERKKIYSDQMASCGSFVSPEHEEVNDDYCVYQLGRAYRPDEEYYTCYHESGDPRARFDVRAYLYEEPSAPPILQVHDELIEDEHDVEALHVVEEVELVPLGEEYLHNEEVCDVVSEQVDVPAEKQGFSFRDVPIFQHDSMILLQHVSRKYAVVIGVFMAVIASFIFVGTSFAVKEKVDDAGKKAIVSLKNAMGNIARNDFNASQQELDAAYEEFVVASEEMGRINGMVTYLSRFVPGISALSSGNHLIEAGKYLTHSVKEMHGVIPNMLQDGGQLVAADGSHISLLALYRSIADRMDVARFDLASAQDHILQVHLDDVPEEYRDTFLEIKELLPDINTSLRLVTEARPTIEDMLGANGPRTYLLLFQNNHEMRATGGFIGSYGIVRIKNGQIEKLFVDDIYNPDGQLIDKVVPPLPIQKISANWSMHDSNWFTHFPTSARKAMDFYERTGGPTVDGVIAITPEMMEKFLHVTGPIDLPQYEVQLTSDNFMRLMQDEIEDRNNYLTQKPQDTKKADVEDVEISKKETQENSGTPKKILADLMPVMVDRLFDVRDTSRLSGVVSAVSTGLKERHVLLYMANSDAQKIIEQNGWSGSILHTDRDYLSVVNTNINGFKTDGVITEQITHTATINDQGEVIDTVRITRHHEGGHTGYPWWDAVNANYMRVYVPEGSELLSVEGQTREINEPRLAYDALGYERDQDVMREEKNMRIDEETGTRIYTEEGKTVFANWAYVSPQETVTVVYTYKLPFTISFDADKEGKFGSYAVLFQKQSGSERSAIESKIELSKGFESVWQAHEGEPLQMKNDLTTDRYNGVVFRVP